MSVHARIIESKWIIIYELVHSVLMQPNRICISSDEFIDTDAINYFGAFNSHLFAVHKYKHELLFPFLFCDLLSRCELFLLFRHICKEPLIGETQH
jgi:hypothetical protein